MQSHLNCHRTAIWDRIRDTHPHLSPSRHLLMGEVEDESGALVSVDLYAHKKLRKVRVHGLNRERG